MSSIVAIVGRPNVGKSTFFNRLTESRDAIVDEVSGVTRDRHYGKCEWNGKEFSVVDTGGYVTNSDDIFEEEIRRQVMMALEECDSIIFMVDVLSGITDLDMAVAGILRKSKKPVFVVVNKVDNHDRIYDAQEFHSLGLGDIYCVSSMSGSGTGEVLDELVKTLEGEIDEMETDIPKYVIVGRPNVGKSSLLNALLGEERAIVTDIAGTTRDTINTRFNKFGHDFYLIDTAGLRKKGKVSEDLEFYSVMRAIRTIEQADVCLLVLDATLGIESQDLNIFQLIEKNGKGVVILVNKWDLFEKDTNSARDYTKLIESKIAPFSDVPIIYTSVINKQRIHKVLEEAAKVNENRRRKILTSRLNEFLQEVVENYPPPSVKGKFVKIKFATQLATQCPSFAFFCNLPQYVKEPYKRYLENKLREYFDYKGVPIRIYMRNK